MLYFFKHSMQSLVYLFLIFKIFIVCTILPRVFPQRLSSIEFWAVRWQIVYFNPFSIFFEPFPSFAALVVRSVVLNVEDFFVFLKHFGSRIFQEVHIGRDIEDFIHVVNELRRSDVDAAKNFDGFSLACDWNQWLATFP